MSQLTYRDVKQKKMGKIVTAKAVRVKERTPTSSLYPSESWASRKEDISRSVRES